MKVNYKMSGAGADHHSAPAPSTTAFVKKGHVMAIAKSTHIVRVPQSKKQFSYSNPRCQKTGRILPANEVEQFWGRVQKSESCWIWTGTIVQRYGQLKFRGIKDKAHRVSWKLANGEIAEGLSVLHKCDNPICVNPAHLFLGTTLENMQDKVSKGRQAKGSAHGRALITETQAIEIIRLLGCGSGYAAIGRELGVKANIVQKIATGKTWKHLPRRAAARRGSD